MLTYSLAERMVVAKLWIKAFAHLTSEYADMEAENAQIRSFLASCSDNEVKRRIEALDSIGNNDYLK